MYDPYDPLDRLNREALRRCEERFLNPDSDYGDYGCCADDEEDNDDPC